MFQKTIKSENSCFWFLILFVFFSPEIGEAQANLSLELEKETQKKETTVCTKGWRTTPRRCALAPSNSGQENKWVKVFMSQYYKKNNNMGLPAVVIIISLQRGIRRSNINSTAHHSTSLIHQNTA